jgi:hypothetical protein
VRGLEPVAKVICVYVALLNLGFHQIACHF